MKWSPILDKAQDDDQWFREFVASAIDSPAPRLPEESQRIGNSNVVWFQTVEGEAFIHAYDGTPDDRVLATTIVKEQLKAHGIKQSSYTFDQEEPFRKTADWDSVMAKAKRLIQSNQVQILRNGYNNVVGHVIGDHGEYQTEIGRDDPQSRAITTWQCDCSPAGTKITLADGSQKNIEDIQTGDLVLTATGHAGIVGRTMNRQYDGRLMGLKIEGGTETSWFTENHKLVTAGIDYREAGDWKTGDFTYLPQPQYVEQESINLSDYLPDLVDRDGYLYRANSTFGSKRLRKASRTSSAVSTIQKPIPARISLDKDFARLAGLFVAEGVTTPRGELRWSFNEKTEQHLADEVIELLALFGLDNAKKKNARSSVTVAVQSKPMSVLFSKLFGIGSRNKKLAMPIMAMPLDSLQVFFDSWVEGDGCTNHKTRHYLSTASDDLASQVRLIMARLGRESVIRRKDTNVSPMVPNGGSINSISWRANGGKGQKVRWFENNQVTQRMIVEEKEFSGTVYNFEVIGEHSYVVGGFASLNCPWDQYAWQRTRQWKKFEGRPCAHVLATYWKALSTPLDEDVNPATGEPNAQQQLFNAPRTAPSPVPFAAPTPTPVPSQQMQIPGVAPGQATGTQPAPADTGVIPPFPMENAGQPLPVSVPGGRPPTPSNPMQWPGGTFSSVQNPWGFDNAWEFDTLPSVTAADFIPQPDGFQSGNMVSNKYEDWGTWVGRSEEHGAGSPAKIPKGCVGEVMSQDPSTKMVQVLFMDKKLGVQEFGNLMPTGATAWFFESELDLRPDVQRPGPAIKRR